MDAAQVAVPYSAIRCCFPKMRVFNLARELWSISCSIIHAESQSWMGVHTIVKTLTCRESSACTCCVRWIGAAMSGVGLFTNFVDSLDSVASSRTMGQFQRPLKGFGVRLLVGRESPCIRLVRSKPANSPTGSCHSHVNYSLRGLSVGGAGRAPTVDAPNCASRELGKPCKFNQGLWMVSL